MNRLLIIGGGEMQVPIIKKAKELNLFCIVTDFDDNAPGFKFADIGLNVSTLDFSKTLEIAQKYEINGVVTTSDLPVRTLAFVTENMGLKGLSTYSAELCTNKYAQRQAMLMGSVYVPMHFLFNTMEEIELSKKGFVFPLIVKPIDSSASRGVTKVENFNELLEASKYAFQFSKGNKIIIEEYIEGPEYSVESLTQNGETNVIAITQKSTIGSNEKYFVESRHIIPADLDNNNENIIVDYIKKIVGLFKIDNSATHAELKLSTKGPVLIEIGARLGGDYITSDLVPLSTGVDMLDNVIKIALNQQITIKKTKSLFAGVRFLNSFNYYQGLQVIDSKNEKIVRSEIKPYKESLITNSLDRLGYVIACTKNRKELEEILNF